jgi:hypothetical protein
MHPSASKALAHKKQAHYREFNACFELHHPVNVYILLERLL